MPNYSYTAKSFQGDAEQGVLAAQDERDLAQQLKAKGLVLIGADIAGKKKRGQISFKLPFNGISVGDKIILTRNMGVMFSTGLSLVKIFEVLAGQERNQTVKRALEDVKEHINKGENFSDALARHPALFSELFCNMVKVGEESGTLDDVFQILSLQMTKEHELRSRVNNAMIYPCIILLVMGVVGIVMVTIVLPSLNTFFTSLNVQIPIYTKILLASGDFVTKRWYVVLAVPLLAAVGIFLASKTKEGKRAIGTLLLRAPLISPIVKKNNSATLVRSLSSLIASGVPLIRSLEIASHTVHNWYFQQAVTDAAEKIKKGEKLSGALQPYRSLFPFGVLEMVEVGEETGKTAAILKKLADFYEEEAAAGIEKLTTLLEPLLIIVLGLGVGMFAFSLIQPMYSSLKAIQ